MTPPRIFHVDDNAEDLLLLRTAFEEAAATVAYDATSDSADALERLRQLAASGRAPSLVILDINMPVSGWDILRRMRGDPMLASVPVVMLSTSRRREDEELGGALAVRAYLVKPRTYGELLDLVPRLVELAS